MHEGDPPVAAVGQEEAALLREIDACDVRLRFLTSAGYDQTRLESFREELRARRAEAVESLAALRRQ
jgi:hypothetical protein